jgi:D-glycero-D-manno-heptose 1,7-bisphosphate phosphatase
LNNQTLNNQTLNNFPSIDKTHTLFLDRDGVINHEKHLDYIHTWDEFVFYEGAKEAMAVFNRLFGPIVVVTNQKGVGKGLTKPEDLATIHRNMAAEIATAGGRVDKVYCCPDLDDASPNRKPNPGMGLQAKADFPQIDFSKAIMVGNTLSDMAFGRSLGMHTVFLTTTRPEVDITDPRIDSVFPSLAAFAQMLLGKN